MGEVRGQLVDLSAPVLAFCCHAWGQLSPSVRPLLILLLCRFEELAYADAASYMEDGRVVFTGSPDQMKARLRAMGASVR
jgi:hypothetical protein